MESEKKYFIIKDRFLKEIDEKEFLDKKYNDDYFIPSLNKNITIIDLDKRNIVPYAMNLLNSMNELSFTRFSRYTFYTTLFIIGLCLFIFFRGNGSDKIINDLGAKITNIQTQINQKDTPPTNPYPTATSHPILRNNK